MVASSIHRGFILRRVIVAAILLVYGAWCVRDGWFNPEYQTAERTLGRRYSKAGAFAFPILGLGVLFYAGALTQKRLIADDDGLRYGRRFMPWSAVTRLDNSELSSAGILRLHYNDSASGEERIWVFDQYQFAQFEVILNAIEAHLPPDLLKPATPEASA